MIFGHSGYLYTRYTPFSGAPAKNDELFEAVLAHPDRFLMSPRSGDPRVLVARLLTSPENIAWEVWRGGTFSGIIIIDRVVPQVEARLQFVFFDDELASKAPLLNEFVARCFADFSLHRLTFEAPTRMTTLAGFVKRELGFSAEGVRVEAYHDGARWYDLATFARLTSGTSGGSL